MPNHNLCGDCTRGLQQYLGALRICPSCDGKELVPNVLDGIRSGDFVVVLREVYEELEKLLDEHQTSVMAHRDHANEMIESTIALHLRLVAALSDAIKSPMGVVPTSAEPFYRNGRVTTVEEQADE